MSKNIEFKVGFNTQEATKQIQELQKRLTEMTKTQSYADRASAQAGSSAGQPGSPHAERVQKMIKEHQEKLLVISKEDLALTQKNFDFKQKQLDRVKAISQAEGLSLEKKKQALELIDKLEQKRLISGAKSLELAEAIAKAEGGAGGGKTIGEPVATAGGKSILDVIKNIGITRIISQAIQGTANVVASTMFEGAQTKTRQVGSIQAGAGKMSGADLILSGRGAEASLYTNERQEALREALKAQGGIGMRGTGDLLGSTIAGAGIGSALGPWGALAGGVAGLGKSLMSGQSGAYIKGVLTPGDTGSESMERFRGQELINNYEQNFEAQKAKNFKRTKAMEFMEGNRDKFINAQQTMGLSDTGLNDMLSSTKRGQFTIDQTLGAANAIAGAGGSSAQMRNANQANELQRDYGLQNATGLTALLSKNVGGGKGVSDEVTKKLLADAFSVGLDASTFGRETEKFVTMSARFVSQSGAESTEAQKAIAALMSNTVTGDSMQRIQAGEDARDEINRQTSGEGTNYEKMLQFSAGRNAGLDMPQSTILMKMTKEQIMAGGPEVDKIVRETGKSKEDLINIKEKMGDNAFTATGVEATTFESYKKTTEAAKEFMPKGTDVYNYEELKAASDKEQDPTKKAALTEAMKTTQDFRYTRGYMKGTKVDTIAEGDALSKGQALYGADSELRELKDAPTLEKGASQKAREADAYSEKAQLGNAKTYLADYTKSVEGISKTSHKMLLALDEFTEAIKNKSKNLEEAAENVIKQGDIDAKRGSASTQRKNNVGPRGSSGGF